MINMLLMNYYRESFGEIALIFARKTATLP
jgi:hypothetical protein